MSDQLQTALISLLGALVVSMPLTIRRLTKARLDFAAAERKQSETTAEALADLRRRLDECEEKHTAAMKEIDGLRRQCASDNDLLLRLGEKSEQDEAIMRGMRIELDDLRKVLQGGRYVRAGG